MGRTRTTIGQELSKGCWVSKLVCKVSQTSATQRTKKNLSFFQFLTVQWSYLVDIFWLTANCFGLPSFHTESADCFWAPLGFDQSTVKVQIQTYHRVLEWWQWVGNILFSTRYHSLSTSMVQIFHAIFLKK